MSIASDARNYADTAVDEGRATLTAVQQRFESWASDAGKRARTVLDDSRSVPAGVLTVTRRQAYAQLGANDALLAVITKRSAELPGETKDIVRQVVEGSKNRIATTAELLATAQQKITSAADEAKDRANAVARTVRSTPARTSAGVKSQLESRVGQVKDAYVKLGERGEQVATDLRHDPVVVRLIGDADTHLETAANQVTSIAQKVRARAAAVAERENAAATATPVRPTAPRQVPAHRTIARNTPAGEAAVSTTPIHRAAAYETEIRKAAAAKAAATRQQKEQEREQAAQARSDAAAKAAATRKQNAERAAAKRQAAAAKAAQTRKENAETREQAAHARSDAAAKAAATRKRNTDRATAKTTSRATAKTTGRATAKTTSVRTAAAAGTAKSPTS